MTLRHCVGHQVALLVRTSDQSVDDAVWRGLVQSVAVTPYLRGFSVVVLTEAQRDGDPTRAIVPHVALSISSVKAVTR